MKKKILTEMAKDVVNEQTLHDVISPFLVKVLDAAFKKVKGPGKKIESKPSAFKFAAVYGDLVVYSRSDLEVKADVTLMIAREVETIMAIVDISRPDWGHGKRSKTLTWKFVMDEKKMVDDIAKEIQQAIDV